MSNIISGQIMVINQAQSIPSKSGGQPLIKREFVIRAIQFSREDGSPELSQNNTPILEINGQEKVGMLDQFKVGDCVKVSFSVEGRSFTGQDGSTRYFNSVRALSISPLQVNLQVQQPQPAQPQPAQGQAPQGGQGNLPF